MRAECKEISATCSLDLRSMLNGMRVWVMFSTSPKINSWEQSRGSWVSVKRHAEKCALYAVVLYCSVNKIITLVGDEVRRFHLAASINTVGSTSGLPLSVASHVVTIQPLNVVRVNLFW